MTIEMKIVSVIRAALDGIDIYDSVGVGEGVPYIVYTQVSGARDTCLMGDQGVSKKRFQIDVYARTPKERNELQKTVRNALFESDMTVIFLSDGTAYEPETKLYRHRQDFSIWSNE